MPGVGGRVSLWRLPLFLPPVAWFLMEQHVKVSVTRSHLHEATASLLWRVEPMSAGRFSLTSFLLGINHSHEKNNWSSQCALFTEISIFTPNHLTNLRFIFFFRWFPLPFPMTFAVWDGIRPKKKKKYYLKLALLIYQSNAELYLNMSHSRLDQLEIKCFKWMHYHITVDQTSS